MPSKIQILEAVFRESEVFIWWRLLLGKCLGILCCSLLFHLVPWNFCLANSTDYSCSLKEWTKLPCSYLCCVQSAQAFPEKFTDRGSLPAVFFFFSVINHVTQLYNAGEAYLSAQDSWVGGGAFCPACRPPNRITFGPFQNLLPGCSFQVKPPDKEGGNSWNQFCTPPARWGSLSTGRTLQTTLFSLHWRDFLELSRCLLQGKL